MQEGLDSSQLLVHGSLMVGFAQACVNLNIVAGQEATQFIRTLDMNSWYPLPQWRELQRLVLRSYKHSDPNMVKVGIEMMMGWYHYGPGKQLIKGGASFLHFQTGSNGFQSVVKGPAELVGSFELDMYDRRHGRAVVHTTTPFHRKMECGVLIGGIMAPGDIDYVDVTNDEDSDMLLVEFH